MGFDRASPLQLGFAWLQLEVLELHGQAHVPCDLQFALEKCLAIGEDQKKRGGGMGG